MRYTVKYIDGNNIVNDLSTNNESESIQRQCELRKKFEDVWVADSVQEILVG